MSHLRLVKEETPKSRRRKGSKPAPALSVEQERAAKAAIRGLATTRFKSLAQMSIALGYERGMLAGALSPRGRVCGDLLVRIALKCSISLEALVTPGPREVPQ